MQRDNAAHDLERIAKAHRLISKATSYGCLSNILLCIENSEAVRITVLVIDDGDLFAKAKSVTPSRRLLHKREFERTGAKLESDLDPSIPKIEADRIPGPMGVSRSRAQRSRCYGRYR